LKETSKVLGLVNSFQGPDILRQLCGGQFFLTMIEEKAYSETLVLSFYGERKKF
jgi:hypothetical protein